jgi:MinD-like ATPase involved in chromosome partitioning or flagellar assembly
VRALSSTDEGNKPDRRFSGGATRLLEGPKPRAQTDPDPNPIEGPTPDPESTPETERSVIVMPKKSHQKLKREPKAQPVIVLPDSVVVPTMGWLGKRYNRNRSSHPERIPHLKKDCVTPTAWASLLQKAHLLGDVPQLSKAEQRAIVAEQERLDAQYEQEQIEYDRLNTNYTMHELCHKQRKLTVAFVQMKGGGATTTEVAWSVTALVDSTRIPGVVAADFNPASGTLADRLDCGPDKTLDLRGLVRRSAGMEQYDDFGEHIGFTVYGVQVVSATSVIKREEKLTGESAKTALRICKDNSRYLYVDTANDITTDVSLEVIESADVLVISANRGVADSLYQIALTMDTLREHGFNEKVDYSVVAISNMRDDDDLQEYRLYLNELYRKTKKIKRNFESLHHGPFVGIPHDPEIDHDQIVNMEAIRPNTYQALRELNQAIFQSAPQFRKDPGQADFIYEEEPPERQIIEGFDHFEPALMGEG